jgi:hypothetical protein
VRAQWSGTRHDPWRFQFPSLRLAPKELDTSLHPIDRFRIGCPPGQCFREPPQLASLAHSRAAAGPPSVLALPVQPTHSLSARNMFARLVTAKEIFSEAPLPRGRKTTAQDARIVGTTACRVPHWMPFCVRSRSLKKKEYTNGSEQKFRCRLHFLALPRALFF